MATPARVYSYIRFSDARQATGASVERQAGYAARWAAEHGLVLDDQLSMQDEGLSAYHQAHVRRGALGVFLAAVDAGRVPVGSVLLVESLDRLSRAEPLTALGQLTSIIDAGVGVVTASDGRTYTRATLKADPMQLMHSLLVMIRAHEESETKSRRVRDAIRRQCLGWQAGTYRGLVRYGQSPGWLRVEAGRWHLAPERAQAVRLAVDMYLAGHGTGPIARALHDAGLSLGRVVPTSGHVTRLLVHPALAGLKVLDLDGERFELPGYYPALLDAPTWQALQEAVASRTRRGVRGDVPSVLTGTGVAYCGYCGAALKAQTMISKRRPDGTLADGHRRLQCVAVNSGQRCRVPGSCSAAPIERALVRYCSDMINLRALYRGDAAALPRAELASAQVRLAELDAQLQRLTEALLSADGAPPATFVARGRELEAQRTAAADAVQAAERALAAASRAALDGADQRWRDLAAGVEALDYTARLQARQLVADTFARLVVYRRGIRPAHTPPGQMDVVLLAKGGRARLLRIGADGGLVAAEDVVG